MRICDACRLENPVGKVQLTWNPTGGQRDGEVRDGEVCKDCAAYIARRDWLGLAQRIVLIRDPQQRDGRPLPADRPINDHPFTGNNLTGTTCERCGRPREEHGILPRSMGRLPVEVGEEMGS